MMIAKTALDTFRVSDGRAIGDVQFFELPTLKRKSQREAYVLDRLSRYFANAPSSAYLRDIAKHTQLEDIIRQADEHLSNVA